MIDIHNTPQAQSREDYVAALERLANFRLLKIALAIRDLDDLAKCINNPVAMQRLTFRKIRGEIVGISKMLTVVCFSDEDVSEKAFSEPPEFSGTRKPPRPASSRRKKAS